MGGGGEGGRRGNLAGRRRWSPKGVAVETAVRETVLVRFQSLEVEPTPPVLID